MLFLQESNLGSTVKSPETLSCISYQFSVGEKIHEDMIPGDMQVEGGEGKVMECC